MFNQYFGQYLLNNHKLTTEQLAEVMNYERSVRVKLGVLAMNASFMTAEQVEIVHHMQRVQDKRFGELAVEQGYLTYNQLEDLLENQHCRHLSLSQAIVDKGYLTLAELEEVLTSYKQQSQVGDDSCEVIDGSDAEQEAPHLVLDFEAVGAQGDVYRDYVALLQRNILRFLDADSVLGKPEAIVETTSQWLVYQQITGEINLFTGLSMDDQTLLTIACQYSGEVLTEIDDLAKDSVAEFLNMVNGIFCVNLSNQGIELDLELQKVIYKESFTVNHGYRIPMHLSFGTIHVIVGTGK